MRDQMSKTIFSKLLVQTQIKLYRMMASLWGKKGSRSADVAMSRLPLAFGESAWSAEPYPPSPFFHTVAVRVFNASHMCLPPADTELALC